MAKQTTVIAAVTASFDTTAVTAAATELAGTDARFESAVASVAGSIARIMGTAPKFDHWESVASAFQTAYRAARDCTEKTAGNRWLAVAESMRASFALEKPAKPTADGARMADKRAKEGAAVDKALKAHKGNPQAILEAAAAAAPDQQKILLKAAGKAADSAAKTAAEKAKAAETKLRADGAALLKSATGDMLANMVNTMRAIAKGKAAPAALV